MLRGEKEKPKRKNEKNERKKRKRGENLVHIFMERERVASLFFPFFKVWFNIFFNPFSHLNCKKGRRGIEKEGLKERREREEEKERKQTNDRNLRCLSSKKGELLVLPWPSTKYS